MTTETKRITKGWRIAWRQSFSDVSELWHTHGKTLHQDEKYVAALCNKTNEGYRISAKGGTPNIVQWYEWYDASTPEEERCDGSYQQERKWRE